MATIAAMTTSSLGSFAVSNRFRSISTARAVSRQAFAFRRAVQIRCKAEPEAESTRSENTPSIPTTPIVPPTPTPVAPKLKTPSFIDIFAFSGPAPEIINGRLAMLGFVAALGTELFTGESLTTQLGGGGVSAFIIAAVLFSTASLIPLFKGVSAQSKSKSFWSSDAEIWNGRAAMIGLVALAITEFVKGSPLV
jgi:hypothetical protein